jgi:hypothetical protein
MAYHALSKLDTAQRQEQADALENAWQRIVEAHQDVAAAVEKLNEKVTAYNEAADTMTEWKNDIAGRIDEEFCERSEKWQESEKGVAYEEWKAAWEEFEVEQIETIEMPELEEPSAWTDLLELPEAPQ